MGKERKEYEDFLAFFDVCSKKERSHQQKRHGTAGNRFSSVSCGYSCKKGDCCAMKEGPTLLSGWTQNDYILWYHGFISKQYGRGQELIKKGTFPAGTDWKTEVEESVCCRKLSIYG